MNYSRAFTYVFEDKNWISKILIAGLISLIPIVGQIYLLGWSIEIVRRVKAGRTDILPATHFTYFLTLGLKMTVVSLIYSIPLILLGLLLQLFTATANNSDSNFVSVLFGGVSCVGGIMTIVVDIAVSLLGCYGMIKLAETDQIKACLDFQDAFNCIKSNLSAFVIVGLLSCVAGLIGSAGVIICIGIIFTIPYGSAITANLVGQLWNNLKKYDSKAKPFRGVVNEEPKTNDIIEEAPFTKVEDIEKEAEEVQEDIHDILEEKAEEAEETLTEAAEEAAEVVEDVQDEVEDAVEEVSETVDEIKEDAEETKSEIADAVEDVKSNIESAVEEVKPEDKSDDDLPKFE